MKKYVFNFVKHAESEIQVNAKVKQQWLDKLRSGDFEQGYLVMCKHNGYVGKDNYIVWYDPMGVLIEIVLGEDTWVDSGDDYDTLEPKGQIGSYFPSDKFLKKVGLDKNKAEIVCGFNDDGACFFEIADFIEKNIS